MRAIVFLALVACGGHHKSVVGDRAPGGGAGSGSGYEYEFKDPYGGSQGGAGYGGGPPKGCNSNPGDPLGGNCERHGPTVWPLDGDMQVVGAIPKDSIHKVVRENFATIRYCYEQVLLANPGIEGRVMVKMTVGLDGAVTDATATGVHPDLETCVAEKIRKFRFPKPDGSSVEITYPFVFKAG